MLMVPEIKICGITRRDEVEFLNALAVQYIGFVFAKSRRQVTPGEAAGLSGYLRKGIKKVGVFTDMNFREIRRIAELCTLDIVQLHGDCTDSEIASLPCPVWKGISMQTPECAESLRRYPSAAAFVLDAYMPGRKGGTGRTFHWEWAEGLSGRYAVVLAGGLNSENVSHGIRIVKPKTVDVSSGVEGPYGKDKQKVIEFIRAVQGENACSRIGVKEEFK